MTERRKGMKVCIAEKPSVAREIATIVGATTKKDGYYEGNGYQVTWTFGHFCTLYTPDNYKSEWKYWDLNYLPMLPEKFEIRLIDNDGVKRQFAIIEKLLNDTDLVINCGDAGQEGELIQRWVLKQANYTGKVDRLWISSLTTEAIREGFENLKDASEYDSLYYAGSSRAIGDWLLGMNATRLYTLKYAGPKQVLSIGRVQTPTLAMLVERYHEIENFKPQPYWELQTLYKTVLFNNEEGRFSKQEDGQEVLEKIQGKPLVVTAMAKKKGKETPPSLFDLTSLQVYCNNKFAFTADQTLKLVQKLYEQKVVTYPRVDTSYLPEDMFPKIPGILSKLSKYGAFTQKLNGKPIPKPKKVFNNKKVTDHHAIIPTGVEINLGMDEFKVYDAITRHFIAAFYPDCLVSNTTINAEVEEVKFKATGKEILDQGWREVFAKTQKDEESSSSEEKILPELTKGESGPHEPSFTEKQTKPPRNYTEASLLRAMETAGKKVEDDELRDLMKANGIGRPSTRANIIETLFKRSYIQRNKKQVLPTEMGIKLIGAIDNELLKSVELTGQWEKQLKDIELGEYKAGLFINNMKRMVYDLVKEVRTSVGGPRISAHVEEPKPKAVKAPIKKEIKDLNCPKCEKGQLLKGKTGYGCSRWKESCDFKVPFEFEGKKVPEKQCLRLIEKGTSTQLKGFIRDGEKLNGRIVMDSSFILSLEVKEDVKAPSKSDDLTCPKCNKGIVIKGQSAYGCNRWQEGCDFRYTFQEVKEKAAYSGKEMSKSLVWEILKS